MKKTKKPGLVGIFFNGELLSKRQFNYRKKKFLNSLSDEDRKEFELILKAYMCLWRSFYNE